LDALSADPEWSKAFFAGNPDARAEFSRLTAQVAAGNPTADALAGAKPAETFEFETTVAGELNTRNRADAVAGLRELGLDDATVTQALDGAPVSAQEVAMAKMMKVAKLSDAAWTDRWLKGGLLERSEMTKINVILSGAAA
jgi:UDP-N-acetylmuramyl pentapeptide synthase